MFICVFIACRKDGTNVCETGTCTIEKPADIYDYPVKGGTPEWAAFTSHQQMEDACQIPADTLAKMSTDGLIQTCMDYPLLGDLLLNIGVNVPGALSNMMQTFSGLIELCKRSDAGIKMIARYSRMDHSCLDTYNSYSEKGKFSSNFTAYEMIISYDSIISKMTIDDKRNLIIIALKKYNCKREQPQNYSYYDFSTSLYIPTKIMIQENYQPFVQQVSSNYHLQIYVNKLLWPLTAEEADSMFNIITQNATTYIK
jgi:hypothetical protein